MKKLKERTSIKIVVLIIMLIALTATILFGAYFQRIFSLGAFQGSVDDTFRNVLFRGYLIGDANELARSVEEPSTEIGEKTDFSDRNYWYTIMLEEKKVASNYNNEPSRFSITELATQYMDSEKSTKAYNVIFFIKQDIVNNSRDGVFAAYEEANNIMRYRYVTTAVMLGSGILTLLCFIFLLSSAGHVKGKEGIYLNGFDKIPYDLLLAVDMLLILTFAGSGFLAFYIFLILLVIATVVSFATRVKAGKWWHNTLVHKLYKLLRLNMSSAIMKTPIVWRAALVFALITAVEFVVINRYVYNSLLMLLFVLERVGLYLLILLGLSWVKQLQQGAKRIAEGDLNHRLDVRQMLFDFRDYGETINSIGGGMNAALEEKMRSERMKTELITNVSHDIKTPLTSIINYVDLLKKEETDNENIKEYTEVLVRQSDKLKRLITDLVDASKISSGNVELNLSPIDICVVAAQLDGEYRDRLSEKQLELVVSCPIEPLYVNADSRHLWRIVENLMSNVLKYSQEGSRVYLNVEGSKSSCTLVIKNMSKYQLNINSEELMERFVRGDSARTTEGNGLGLSIARSLANAQGADFKLHIDGDLFKVELRFPKIGPSSQASPITVQ